MTLKPTRKAAFTPPPEMTGETDIDPGFIGTEWVEPYSPALSGPVHGSGAERPTPHHAWIDYTGSEVIYGLGKDPLPADADLFVVTTDGGKLHPKRMTVAEMVAARDSADYPTMYRVA